MHGNTWAYRGIHGHTRSYSVVHGHTLTYTRIHGNTWPYMGIHWFTWSPQSHLSPQCWCVNTRRSQQIGKAKHGHTYSYTGIHWQVQASLCPPAYKRLQNSPTLLNHIFAILLDVTLKLGHFTEFLGALSSSVHRFSLPCQNQNLKNHWRIYVIE